jgi:hypothetical protein
MYGKSETQSHKCYVVPHRNIANPAGCVKRQRGKPLWVQTSFGAPVPRGRVQSEGVQAQRSRPWCVLVIKSRPGTTLQTLSRLSVTPPPKIF